MPAPTSVLLIINPVSGGGRAVRALPAVESRLASLGIAHRSVLTRDMDHAAELTRDALARGEVPVSLSGDGVAGAVAAAAAGHGPEAVVGILPGGSGNDFCRHAGIPRDPVAACDVLATGIARPIDLGELNGRRFLGIATVGFDSEANALANRAPRALGRGIYVYGALGAVARWRPASFTVRLDGEEQSFEGWSVVIANTSVYGGGMFIAPQAQVDDGLFDVVLERRTGRARFLAALPRVFSGAHVNAPNVTVVRAREVHVQASRPFDVYADGDPVASLPATARVVPGAVRVLLPA